VLLQVIDPQGFAGTEAFKRESQWLVEACRRNRVRPGDLPVRLPGQRALQLRREQLAGGVSLYPSIMPTIEPWAYKLGIPMPTEMNG
jgi:L-lactate dehydrogenase